MPTTCPICGTILEADDFCPTCNRRVTEDILRARIEMLEGAIAGWQSLDEERKKFPPLNLYTIKLNSTTTGDTVKVAVVMAKTKEDAHTLAVSTLDMYVQLMSVEEADYRLEVTEHIGKYPKVVLVVPDAGENVDWVAANVLEVGGSGETPEGGNDE